MHPRIARLVEEFSALLQVSAWPTQWDHDQLQRLINAITGLVTEPGVELSENDCVDQRRLYVEAAAEFDRQKELYHRNGCNWATRPYAEMSDGEAADAIRTCIRRRLRGGRDVADIDVGLEDEVGVTGVRITITPPPVHYRLPELERHEFKFEFVVAGPSGKEISGSGA